MNEDNLKKIEKIREHCYTALYITVSVLAGVGLGTVMLAIERVLK